MSDPPQVHVVPETSSDDRMHELSDGCWCRPWNEFVMNSANRRNDWVITHKPIPPAAAVLPEDGCAECTEAGTKNCIAGCRPDTPH